MQGYFEIPLLTTEFLLRKISYSHPSAARSLYEVKTHLAEQVYQLALVSGACRLPKPLAAYARPIKGRWIA
jgi:hypothetical protein